MSAPTLELRRGTTGLRAPAAATPAPDRRQSRLVAALGLLTSVGLLMLVVRRIDLGSTWRHLTGLSPHWLMPAAAAGFGSLVLRAWRWRLIFPAGARPGLWASFRALSLGNLLNLVLPARAGDVARCFLSRRGNPESHLSTALAALSLEKIFDGLAALAVLGGASCVLDPPLWLRGLALAAAIIFVGALFALVVLRRWAAPALRVLRAVAHRLGRDAAEERLVGLVSRFLAGLDALGSPGQGAVLMLLTVGVWGAEAIAVAGLAAALGVALGPGGAVVTSSVIALATMVPSAPGYVGTYEFFAVASLGLFGLAPSAALALTVVMHAWSYGLIAATGLMSWATEGWRWGTDCRSVAAARHLKSDSEGATLGAAGFCDHLPKGDGFSGGA